MTPVDLVLNGRDETKRLVAGLASIDGSVHGAVHLGSGSPDGEALAAPAAGALIA